MKTKSLILLISLIWISCKSKNITYQEIGNMKFVNVQSFGADPNATVDARNAIQRAFQQHENVFFPKGNYLLESKTTKNALLYIDESYSVRNIIFEEGAEISVSNNVPTDHKRPIVLSIVAGNRNLSKVYIEGLTIEASEVSKNIELKGIQAYERPGKNIENLQLKNITIKNVGGTAISTHALNNHFLNITTVNSGRHGIGISNYSNPNQLHHFFLNGFYSEGDNSYSIDFSGAVSKIDRNQAQKTDRWKGVVKNVISKNSKYGVKTAGYWDLEIQNMQILGSLNNGFYISKDAPGTNILIDNLLVENAQSTGLFLKGETEFIGKNIQLVGCKAGIQIVKAKTQIDSLIIDGQFKNKAGIRMGTSEVEIKNFEIRNNAKTDPYPIWVNGKKVILENGKFIDNQSSHEMIIKENAQNVTLKGLSFGNGSSPDNMKNGLINMQNKGSTQVINCDFSKLTGKKIEDRSKKTVIRNSKGIKEQ